MNNKWLSPGLLAIVIVVVYLPSAGGEFLDWDDGWLVVSNPHLKAPLGQAATAFFTKLDFDTRTQLGAEYLPVRDLVMWLEVSALGMSAPRLRLMNILWYVLGVLLIRLYLRRTLRSAEAAEAATWLFALHPLHVEVVAWVSSHKDTLSYVFLGGALLVHATAHRLRPLLVPLLLLAAHFSKAPTIIAVGLLLAHDLYQGRRLDWRVYLPTTAAAAFALALHNHVGNFVGIPAEFGSEGRLGMAATMGPVWLRDLGSILFPYDLSAMYFVPDRSPGDAAAWLGWAAVAALTGAAIFAWRSGHRVAVLALAWLVIPRLPTSQILVPLQNRMADRYLFLCVLAPALLLGIAAATRWKVGRVAVAIIALLLAASTSLRSAAFTSNLTLWSDTASKLLPEIERAEGEPPEVARKALGNFAAAVVARGRLDQGEAIYRAVVKRWPNDPKGLNNLAEIVFRQGRHDESRKLFLELVERFPRYPMGRRNYELHFGPLPTKLPDSADAQNIPTEDPVHEAPEEGQEEDQ